MISCAQKAIPSGNVEFSLIDGLHLSQSDGSVSATFTTIVLRHLENREIGFSYFREFLRVLGNGGTIMVGLPLYQFPVETGVVRNLMSAVYAVRRSFGNIKANLKRTMGKKTMRRTQYPIKSLRIFLADLGFTNIGIRLFPVTSNSMCDSFILATK